MDAKSNVLLWTMTVLTIFSVSATFYKTVVLQDFEVYESEEEETFVDENDTTDNQEEPDAELVPTEIEEVPVTDGVNIDNGTETESSEENQILLDTTE